MNEIKYPRLNVHRGTVSKQIAVRAALGLVSGLAFAVFELGLYFFIFDRFFHDLTLEPARSISSAFGFLNAPAEWLSSLWTQVLQMPPRGEIAWVIVPIAMTLLQWGTIGLIAGLAWGLKSLRITPCER